VQDQLIASPWEHGKAQGLIKTGRNTIFSGVNTPIRSAEFRAAETLHGWVLDESMVLSLDDFWRAIEAAHTPDERGNYTPHAPAIARSLQKGAVK
jgi:hypothetical protein